MQSSLKRESDIDSIRLYIQEISRFSLLSFEEELELGRRIKAGDKEAEEKLINANLRLCLFIAKRHVGKGVDFSDLYSAGNEGLVIAARTFDPEKKYKFSTYAAVIIERHIEIEIQKNGRTIRLPRNIVEQISLIKQVQRRLRQELHYEPNYEEIAKETNMTEEEIMKIICISQSMISLNSKRLEDKELLENVPDERQDMDLVTSQKGYYEEVLRILKSIKNISDRGLELLLLRSGCVDGRRWTLEECGRLYKTTRQAAEVMEKRTIAKILNSKQARELAAYVSSSERAFNNLSSKYQRETMRYLLQRVTKSRMAAQVLSLKMGYIDGVEYSDGEIAERTNQTLSDVVDIIQKALSCINSSEEREKAFELDPRMRTLVSAINDPVKTF